VVSSAALLLIRFFSQNYSGDVNNHSGGIGFFIHFTPESIFTSRRNRYSHHSGTIIHMNRNRNAARHSDPASNWIASGTTIPIPFERIVAKRKLKLRGTLYRCISSPSFQIGTAEATRQVGGPYLINPRKLVILSAAALQGPTRSTAAPANIRSKNGHPKPLVTISL
jgi:hypothetical protein